MSGSRERLSVAERIDLTTKGTREFMGGNLTPKELAHFIWQTVSSAHPEEFVQVLLTTAGTRKTEKEQEKQWASVKMPIEEAARRYYDKGMSLKELLWRIRNPQSRPDSFREALRRARAPKNSK